ncbi:MAG: hypothetical protein LBD13_02590 [Spirochaetaceae bacterium]|jgi:hypothetical protein|nr:hypothetical protein [Spirochaetaceae bacterium]
MKKMMALLPLLPLLFLSLARLLIPVPVCAQEAVQDESPPAPLPGAPEKQDPPAEAAQFPLFRYFAWAKPFAERKDFVLAAVSALWTPDAQGIGEEIFALHWSFLPFTSIGGGLNLSGLFGQGLFPQSLTLVHKAGVVLPLTPRLKIFGDLTLEIGLGEPSAVSGAALALALGYDAGFTVMLDTDFGIEITYKGLWKPDRAYVNALGFGWLWNFWR